MTPLPDKTLIALATAWGSRFGGVNAFNSDLLKAFSAAYWEHVKIVCVVPNATAEAIQDALESNQITLVSLGLAENAALKPENEPAMWQALQALGFPHKTEDTIWLGHDRLTGAIANLAAKERGGRSALIHHMSYAHYEAFAESSNAAYEKVTEQRHLFKNANVCFAVGPLLHDALVDMIDNPNVNMLIPGLPDIKTKQLRKVFKAFVSGRLNDNAKKIKQGYLGIAAFAHAIHRCDSDHGLPEVLRGEKEPRLTLRGVVFDVIEEQNKADAEADLRRYAETHSNRSINLIALPYTEDRNTLFEELSASSVCMMPSWHEGFGLVAWEAIAAGVPLIVSKKSGVYQLLDKLEGGLYKSWVLPIDVRGQHDEPFFRETDKEALANVLIEIAKSPEKFIQNAIRLRSALIDLYSWRQCAKQLAEGIGWSAIDVVHEESNESPVFIVPYNVATINTIAIDTLTTELDRWIELPMPNWQAHHGLAPSQLLRAEEALIPFSEAREHYLQTQLSWANSTDYPIAVRLLTGQGGTGKTRLALELCQRLAKAGWQTGFLLSDQQTGDMLALAKQLQISNKPICIVLDYAETRTPVLLALLSALLQQQRSAPTRILLLARDSGEWWQQLPSKNADCESLLEGSASTGPYTLPRLYETVTERQAAYSQALEIFATQLSITAPTMQPNLDATHFAHPLYLQMAALMAVLGEQAESAEALPRALINHERRYWQRAVKDLPMGAAQSASLLIALATLCGSIATVRDAEEIWKTAGGEKNLLKPLFRALSPLYPSRVGLQGLRPDLLGEALVAQIILSPDGSHLLDTVLGSSQASIRHSGLTVLARTLRQSTDIAIALQEALTRQFIHCAKDLVNVCIETPSPLSDLAVDSFEAMPPNQTSQVAGVLDTSLDDDILPLSGLKLAVRRKQYSFAQRRAEKKHSTIEDFYLMAHRVGQLSIACYEQGKSVEAFEFAEQALKKFKILLEKNRDRFEPNSARSIDFYANRLGDVGRDDEALTYSKQALDIRERLARDKSERFEPDWATSLSNYALCLSNVRRDDEALTYAKQALDIQERLARDKPERFEPDWAMSLSNYASHLSDVGRDDEALNYSKLALDIRERLAQNKPERFEPNWATSLSNYASHLSDVGRDDEALICAKQALDIRERLARDKPERFEPNWATSLSNYASHLNNVGRADEALSYAKHALDIQELLAQQKPERFKPDWAKSLSNYASHLSDVGRADEALTYAKHALDIRELLAQQKPERFEPDWATSLNNYASHLTDLGRYDEALAHCKKALSIYSNLTSIRRARFAANNYSLVYFSEHLIWLMNDSLELEIPNLDLSGLPASKANPIVFVSRTLKAFSYANHSSLRICVDLAFASWNTLFSSQKQNNQAMYILLCALAHTRLGAEHAPSDWRAFLEKMRLKRHGRQPAWMVKAALRLKVLL